MSFLIHKSDNIILGFGWLGLRKLTATGFTVKADFGGENKRFKIAGISHFC
jgi:hypothetical protein